MISPIRIIDSGIQIELYTGIFKVCVLGGWDVVIGDFTFSLTNIKSGRRIYPKITRWRIQSHEFGQRAKRIMVIDIPERGNYEIEFKNQDSLKVWKSSLPLTNRLFGHPIEKQYIQICIK